MSDDLQRARLLVDAGRTDQARAVLSTHLARRPDDVDALCLLARLQARAGDDAQALRNAAAAAAMAPSDAEVLGTLAEVHTCAGRLEQAVGAAREAARLEPFDPGRHIALATALSDSHQHAAAWDAAVAAVQLAPDQPHGHEAVGYVALGAGWVDRAEEALRNALALDPASVSATHNLGLVHERRGDWHPAAATFASAVRLDPTLPLSSRKVVEVCWQMLVGCALLPLVAALGPLFALRGSDEAEHRLTVAISFAAALVTVAYLLVRGLLRLPPPVRGVLRRRVLQDRWGVACQAVLAGALGLWCLFPFRPLSDAPEFAGALAASGLLAGGFALVGYVRA